MGALQSSTVHGAERPEAGCPIPDRLDRWDLALLGGLVALGLVPFVGLALGGHWSVARLLLGAALVLGGGCQIAAELRRSPAGGRRHGLRVPRPRVVLLRGHLGPGAALRPLVRGRVRGRR